MEQYTHIHHTVCHKLLSRLHMGTEFIIVWCHRRHTNQVTYSGRRADSLFYCVHALSSWAWVSQTASVPGSRQERAASMSQATIQCASDWVDSNGSHNACLRSYPSLRFWNGPKCVPLARELQTCIKLLAVWQGSEIYHSKGVRQRGSTIMQDFLRCFSLCLCRHQNIQNHSTLDWPEIRFNQRLIISWNLASHVQGKPNWAA